MILLLVLALWILLVAAVIYRELPLWLGSILAALSWWLLGYASPTLHHPLLWLPLLAVLLVLNIPALRRPLISARLKRQLATLLPPMSITEREALEAGTAWWDKELFSGKPDWSWFAATALPQLTAREQAFLDNEVETLCGMLDEWQIQHELKDLPPAVWQFLKDKGFFGFIIPPAYGGLGFSPYAQSCVMTKLATRSITAAVSAMVPNSLGPGELLLEFGTDAQKQRWLPGLASGAEIPCFGLTGPEAGSDAGSIRIAAWCVTDCTRARRCWAFALRLLSVGLPWRRSPRWLVWRLNYSIPSYCSHAPVLLRQTLLQKARLLASRGAPITASPACYCRPIIRAWKSVCATTPAHRL